MDVGSRFWLAGMAKLYIRIHFHQKVTRTYQIQFELI